MKESLRRIAAVIFSPCGAFEKIREEPLWGWVFALTAGARATLIFFSALVISRTGPYAIPGPPETEISLAARISAAVLSVPVLPLKWLLYSALLYFLARPVARGQVFFRPVYAAVAHVEIVPILASTTSLVLLGITGSNAPAGRLALAVGSYIRAPENLALQSLLDQCTIFELWYVALLAVALTVVGRCGTWSAILLASGAWTLGAVLQAVLGTLTGGS